MKKVYLMLLATVLGVSMMAGSASAGSIAPSLPPASYPVKGEAELSVTQNSTTYNLYVDWVIYGPTQTPIGIHGVENDWYISRGSLDVNATGNYIYLYQLENPDLNSNGIDEFAIQPMNAGNTTGIGWINGHDLDGGLHTITGEVCEPANLDNVYSTSVDVYWGKVEWGFEDEPTDDGLQRYYESETMWLVSPFGPQYFPAFANDGLGAQYPFTGSVPAPAPEPSSIFLLGLGLLGFGGSVIKRRFKA